MKIKASPYARLFWTEYQLDPSRTDYNIVFDQTIVGDLDLVQLNKAVNRFVCDHVLINSHLIEEEQNLYWVKNTSVSNLEIFNSSKNQVDFVNKPFNLELGPLYRFGVFQKSDQQYIFIVVFHHVLIDGLSFDSFLDQFSNYYNNTAIQKLGNQEKKIIALTNILESKILSNFEDSKKFWSEKLKGLPPKNELPYSLSKNKPNLVGEQRFSIKKSDYVSWTDNLNIKISSNNIFMLIWAVLIARYSHQKKVHIGYPIAIKQGKDFIYGAHVNTLVFALHLDNRTNFLQLIEHFNNDLAAVVNNKYLPIEYIIQASPIKKLNVGFAQTNLQDKVFEFKQCQADVNQLFNINIAGSELSLEYEEKEDCFNFRLRYQSHLFDSNYVKQIARHYINLVKIAINNPKQKIAELSLLDKQEYHQLVYDWNKTDRAYPKDKTIHQLFEEQVKRTPSNVAVVFEDRQMTYRELNQKSNQLARYIRKQYKQQTKSIIKSDTLIALCVDRSLDTVVAILAVLKSGGTYVPIDPGYPDKRIEFILKDTQINMLLTQRHLKKRLDKIADHIGIKSPSILVDDDITYHNQSVNSLSLKTKATDLAYIIYTSGTTGQPKGVMIEHKGVVNIITYRISKFGFNDSETGMLFASYVFDGCAAELFLPILSGAKLVIFNKEDVLSEANIRNLIENQKITHVNMPPILLGAIRNMKFSSIRRIATGGEGCNKHVFDYYKDILINDYGPTETS
ncbi:MAG: AMP-binding protein, partial [Pseudomonadota bacterium]